MKAIVTNVFITVSFSVCGTSTDERATMSRNITMVLENLLRNYDNSQPPSTREVATTIRTNMLIRSMGPISELGMDYSMECYFRQSWRDDRLSFTGPIESLSLSIKMLERIWRPDTYFHNGKRSYLHTNTIPNKLLRISQDGDILYSMRLTVKAKCPMELKNFPMDSQSCPLVLGSYTYTRKILVYEWEKGESVSFVPGMTLSQFDLIDCPLENLTVVRRREEYSVLQVKFNLKRNTGYFLIQVYLPCVLIVVLSWVSFWINREATSDRVGLGITTVLTLSTISLDSRTDLPKVGYATALDWFLLMSFLYCVATLLEFAGVHYFTKVGSGDTMIDEDEWEELLEMCVTHEDEKSNGGICHVCKRSTEISPGYQPSMSHSSSGRKRSDLEAQTDLRTSTFRSFLLCLTGNDDFRRFRQLEAAASSYKTGDSDGRVNSVSEIDKAARIFFPLTFAVFNFIYWAFYLHVA